jgi:hypothetical protein
LFNNKSRELINQPKCRERTRKSKILILNNSTFLFIFTYLIPATIKFHKTFKGLRKIKYSFHYTKMRFTFFCDSFKRHWELMFYNSLINLSLSFVSATQLHFIYVLKKNWKTQFFFCQKERHVSRTKHERESCFVVSLRVTNMNLQTQCISGTPKKYLYLLLLIKKILHFDLALSFSKIKINHKNKSALTYIISL